MRTLLRTLLCKWTLLDTFCSKNLVEKLLCGHFWTLFLANWPLLF
nr:MAG TPA: hypothetical protein [Caudoviricetes sp.]